MPLRHEKAFHVKHCKTFSYQYQGKTIEARGMVVCHFRYHGHDVLYLFLPSSRGYPHLFFIPAFFLSSPRKRGSISGM
jgi:hypothetical protein